MLDPYRRILRLPGAMAFSGAGLVARLPISMLSLGIVILVSARTGSYALAGSISAAEVLAAAIVSPLQGRLVDRFGQARVLLAAASLFAVGVAALVVSVEQRWPTPLPHVCAVISGAAFPQIGSSIRARWRHIVPDRSMLDTAFAFEAVVDEMVFIIGPVLVTFLATNVDPLAGVASTAVLCLVGTLLLAVQRSTQPPIGRDDSTGLGAPLGWRVLAPLVLAAVGLGSLFGGTEVVTVAFAEAAGDASDAGWLLALWATGSLVAGLVTGSLTLRRSPLARLRLGAIMLTAVMAPLVFAPTIAWVAVLLLFAGLAISPTLVATISLVEQCVPPARLTEGIAWVTAGIATGIAPGAAIGGAVIDAAGPTAGFVVPVVAGAFTAIVAWVMRVPIGARPEGLPAPVRLG
ncbi:MAG: MFS transporter [Actinomycetota bacterium]|nr:MFS transporter [Actinomycetota bacterium]